VQKEQLQLCRGFTVQQWNTLRPRLGVGEDEAWRIALNVFERRIKERFLSSIEALRNADSKDDIEPPDNSAPGSTLPNDTTAVVPGFAMVALCCLLAETLQSFRSGPSRYTKTQFINFLQQRPAFHGAFADAEVAASFVDGVRNGIFHEAETRGWSLWRDEPRGLVEPLGNGRYSLNRNEFHDAVRTDFEDYIASLRVRDSDLRQSFLQQMDDLVEKS
jgi:hypothetical protein